MCLCAAGVCELSLPKEQSLGLSFVGHAVPRLHLPSPPLCPLALRLG